MKFQAVLELLRGWEVALVARSYGVHPVSLGEWKRRVLGHGPELFSGDTVIREYERRITELEQLLGKKEIELAVLKSFVTASR